MELLARFFSKYPEYVDKTFVSVKGGIDWTKQGPNGSYVDRLYSYRHELAHLSPNCSLEYLRKSVDNSTKALGPTKSIDLFEPARIDHRVPIDELARNLRILKDEGKFKHLGLSECKAETVRKINDVGPLPGGMHDTPSLMTCTYRLFPSRPWK